MAENYSPMSYYRLGQAYPRSEFRAAYPKKRRFNLFIEPDFVEVIHHHRPRRARSEIWNKWRRWKRSANAHGVTASNAASLIAPQTLTQPGMCIVRNSEAHNSNFELFTENQPTREPYFISPFVTQKIKNLIPPGGPYPDTLGAGRWEGRDTGDFPQDTGNPPFPPAVLDYDGMKARCKDLAARYKNVVYESIGNTYGSTTYNIPASEIPALRINDDGVRPIIFWDLAPHGSEGTSATAMFDLIEMMLSGNHQGDPVLPYVNKNFTTYVVAPHNPDGFQKTGGDPDFAENPIPPATDEFPGRNNSRDVNLNRQEPNYWDYRKDRDKGTAPFSEIESSGVRDWLLLNNRIERVLFYCQLHAWNSRPNLGYLTEWQLHSIRNMRTIRSCYLHGVHLLRSRDISGYTVKKKMEFENWTSGGGQIFDRGEKVYVTDPNTPPFAKTTDTEFKDRYQPKDEGWVYFKEDNGAFAVGQTITDGKDTADVKSLAAVHNPHYQLFNSKMKPYLAEYVWVRSKQPGCACCLYEYSEQETSFGYVNSVTLDVLHGMLAGAVEAHQPEQSGYLVTPAYRQVLNNNSNFKTWQSSENRASWMRINGIFNTHYPTGLGNDTRPFVNMARPQDSVWPAQKGRGAYYNVERFTYKYKDRNATAFVARETLTGFISGAKAYILSDTYNGDGTGTLTLKDVNGGATPATFTDTEVITSPGGASATADGFVMAHADNAFYIYGGRSTSGTLSSGHKERHEPIGTTVTLPTFIPKAASALPDRIQRAALCWDGTYLYHVCGASVSGTQTTYVPFIYRAVSDDEGKETSVGDEWTDPAWHTLTSWPGHPTNPTEIDYRVGVQRHTAHVWHNPAGYDEIVIIGGRDGDQSSDPNHDGTPGQGNYTSEILMVRTDDKTERVLGAELPLNLGFHTSEIIQDRNIIYVFGGFSLAGGAAYRRDIYKIDLAGESVATLAAKIPTATSHMASAFCQDAMVIYLCCGADQHKTNSSTPVKPDGIVSTVYKFDINAETVSTVDYNLISSDDTDDEGASAVSEEPLMAESHAWIKRESYDSGEVDDTLLIVAGEDENVPDQYRDSVYEMNTVSEEMYERRTNNARWGYYRPSVKFDDSHNFGIDPGEERQGVGLMVCRSRYPIRDDRVPYARLSIITGPLSNWEQIHRHQYFVPPRNLDGNDLKSAWQTFSFAFRLKTLADPNVQVGRGRVNEEEWRLYARIYGDQTDFDMAMLQGVSGKYCVAALPLTARITFNTMTSQFTVGAELTGTDSNATGTIDEIVMNGDGVSGTLKLKDLSISTSGTNGPFLSGEIITDDNVPSGSATSTSVANAKAADVLTCIFENDVNTDDNGTRTVIIPFSPCYGTQMEVNEQLFDFTLGTGDISQLELWYESREIMDKDVAITPSLFETDPEGEFVLKWTDTGGVQTKKLLEDCELNYLRVTRTWLRDMVYVILKNDPVTDQITISLWFYGLQEDTLLRGSGSVSGYTSTGGGAIYGAAIETFVPGGGGGGGIPGSPTGGSSERTDWFERREPDKQTWYEQREPDKGDWKKE